MNFYKPVECQSLEKEDDEPLNPSKILIYSVRVKETDSKSFEKLMHEKGFSCNYTGEFRIANLNAWNKGTQKPLL